MAGDADPGVVIVRKDIVHYGLATCDLMGRGLALVLVTSPQQVVLRKALLKQEMRRECVDLSLGRAAVAGVDADALTEELLDSGLEGVRVRQVEGGKGNIGRLNASLERRAVVGLKVRQLLLFEA